MSLTVTPTPISHRAYYGLGVQADAYIYDETNRDMGVGPKDLELFERRLQALRPDIVRVFANIDLFNPSFDAATYEWTLPAFRQFVDHLHNVRAAGAKVNVCMAPWTNAQMMKEGMEKTAVDLVEHLRGVEGLDNVAWVCLFNEPDSMYAHQSDIYRAVFGEEAMAKRPPWSDYVAKNLWTQEELIRRGLYPQVRLVVADTVWGHPIRRDRIELAARDFAPVDVQYSYHHYNPDFPEYYDKPEYAYPGVAPEAQQFRHLLGSDRELLVWEFNNAGPGFGGFFPGTGRYGEDLNGSLAGGVELADKVLTALANGIDGMCLWCICDSYYNCGTKTGPMRFGLWRFRWEGWKPRPIYYYYTALMHTLRGGMRLHAVESDNEGVMALAGTDGKAWRVAVLNRRSVPIRTALQFPATGRLERLRVYPEKLPTKDEMPVSDWEPIPADGKNVDLDLRPAELTIVRTAERPGT